MQIQRLLIRHIQHLQTNIEYGVCDHPQLFLLKCEPQFRRVIQESLVQHGLGGVLRPAFDVRRVAVERAQQAAG